jgi:hypothetical protein
MNPTTQVIKRFCCTLSSGRCSRCLHAARVFARAASLQLDTQTLLLSMPYFAEARTLGGSLGGGWLYCAQMPHAAMQLGRDSSVLAGRVSTQGATANYAAIGNSHAGRVSRPRTALAQPGDCTRVHVCQVIQTRTGFTLQRYTGFLQYL